VIGDFEEAPPPLDADPELPAVLELEVLLLLLELPQPAATTATAQSKSPTLSHLIVVLSPPLRVS
jgi:hypothetical protein